MGVEVAIWRWRVGCFSQWRGATAKTRNSLLHIDRRPLRKYIFATLMFLTMVGMMSEPLNMSNAASSTLVLQLDSYVLIAGVSSGVRPPGLVHGATVTECSVFSDARHSILLSRAQLIRSGVEQNPGPPKTVTGVKTRQSRLDLQGNITLDEDTAATPSQPISQCDPTLLAILTELRDMRKEVREDITSVKQRVSEQATDIKQIDDRQTTLEKENSVLQDKIERLEDHNRRLNLIVGGIAEGTDRETRETWEEAEEKVRQALIVDLGLDATKVDNIDIEKASRLGKPGKPGERCRVIKVAFTNMKDRDMVLKRAREVKPASPYIREDFSVAVLDARSKLKPGLASARDKSKNLQAFLTHDKLVVQKDGKKNVYRYNRECGQVKPVAHSFDDGIVWQNETVTDR